MGHKSGTSKDAADRLVRGIMQKTRQQYSAEEKIKKQTIRKRRLQHQSAAAQAQTETEPEPSL